MGTEFLEGTESNTLLLQNFCHFKVGALIVVSNKV